MPYIEQWRRNHLDAGVGHTPKNVGELTYVFTRIAHRYVEDHGLNFAEASDVVAALECAKLEFYRRVLAPYEDAKITANGDVLPSTMVER